MQLITTQFLPIKKVDIYINELFEKSIIYISIQEPRV